MRIALFAGCLADTLFPNAARSTLTVLEHLGHDVDFPLEQTCCGQIHINSGYAAEAIPLLRRFVRTFADSEAVVTPSGSCAATVVEAYPRIAEASGDTALQRELALLRPRVHELSQFLVDVLGTDQVGASFPHRVTYHPACHSTRLLGVGDAPLRLLRGVDGLELVDLPASGQCCGFGGTFAVKNAATSTAMLTDKMRHVMETGAEVCTATDSSCLMQIGSGLQRAQAGVRVMHVAEILASRGADR